MKLSYINAVESALLQGVDTGGIGQSDRVARLHLCGGRHQTVAVRSTRVQTLNTCI